mmetsp:Transcript_22112/g.50592  ORF Transcript_22112/g.50592 Transcript_22112/m.50592 type:complete len:285 (+) Transcript_22112:66-920(+)
MWSLQAAFVSAPSGTRATATTTSASLQARKVGALGFSGQSQLRGGLVGVSAVVGALAGALARRRVKALVKTARKAKCCEAGKAKCGESRKSKCCETGKSKCCESGKCSEASSQNSELEATIDLSDLSSRRTVVAVASALLALTRSEEAAEAKIIDDGDVCRACAGAGLVVCPTCNGTGQYRLLNANSADGRTSMQAQFYDCPECRALGELCCPACYATGLPNKELRGFLRNPDFAEAVQFIKDNRVSPENIKDYQALVFKGLERVKEKRAAKAAAKQQQQAATV